MTLTWKEQLKTAPSFVQFSLWFKIKGWRCSCLGKRLMWDWSKRTFIPNANIFTWFILQSYLGQGLCLTFSLPGRSLVRPQPNLDKFSAAIWSRRQLPAHRSTDNFIPTHPRSTFKGCIISTAVALVVVTVYWGVTHPSNPLALSECKQCECFKKWSRVSRVSAVSVRMI